MQFRLLEDSERSAETKSVMDIMIANNSMQDDPMIGSFWYDIYNNELFGIYSVLADDVQFYHSNFYNADVRTGRKLHKDIWTKEHFKGKDKRFNGDYTKIPRGRVLEFKDSGFKIYVGDWIKDYPECVDLIVDEFQLPVDNTNIVIDHHWNIGHGWSDVTQ